MTEERKRFLPLDIELALDETAQSFDRGEQGRGREFLSRYMGLKETTLRNCIECRGGTSPIGVDLFIKVIEKTGSLKPLKALCAYFGGMYVPRPDFEVDKQELEDLRSKAELAKANYVITKAKFIESGGGIDAEELKILLKMQDDVQAAERAAHECEMMLYKVA